MSDYQLRELKDQLLTLRATLTERRNRLSSYAFCFPREKCCLLARNAGNAILDAEAALDTNPPNLHTVRTQLDIAQAELDRIDLTIEVYLIHSEIAIGLLALVSVIGIGALSIAVWNPETRWDFWPFTKLAKSQWPIVRLFFFAAFGGIIGASVDLGRILYLAIPARTLDPRSILWYLFAPLFGGALGAAFYLLVYTGMTTVTSHGTKLAPGSASSAFALGFLVGFVPTTVFYRINGVVKAVFGTDEVSSPVIAPPQLRKHGSTIAVLTAIQASTATRITSANAILHTPAGSTPVGLRKTAGYQWVGELKLPSQPLDMKTATVTVEARDERGSVSRSEAVSLANLPPEDVDTLAEQPSTATTVTADPPAGSTISADAPLHLRFAVPMSDADPALTDAQGTSIDLEKAWSPDMTELTLTHPPLAPGSYRLVLEMMQRSDGSEVEEEFDTTYTVA